jgi:hypothetical protein
VSWISPVNEACLSVHPLHAQKNTEFSEYFASEWAVAIQAPVLAHFGLEIKLKKLLWFVRLKSNWTDLQRLALIGPYFPRVTRGREERSRFLRQLSVFRDNQFSRHHSVDYKKIQWFKSPEYLNINYISVCLKNNSRSWRLEDCCSRIWSIF